MCVIFASHAPVYNGLPDWQSQMRCRQATGKERIHQEAKAKAHQKPIRICWYMILKFRIFPRKLRYRKPCQLPNSWKMLQHEDERYQWKTAGRNRPAELYGQPTGNRNGCNNSQTTPNISAWNCFPHHEVYAGENYQMQRKIYFEEHRRRFETKNDTFKISQSSENPFPSVCFGFSGCIRRDSDFGKWRGKNSLYNHLFIQNL